MADQKFYFNPTTGEVTEGKVAGWDDRMGPYDTREEAERALETARERTKRADDEDEADDNWGAPASWEK
ncbi:hypothetical protein [Corynebacterium aquatimens]|uniref:SPOR domain-containing protein n=1 Tax=Corynebacterium aquatimens TaxID=1190508 RepID=A0A931DZP8_9CORY|nr:hypothetical protein [Corynebacterium aquatimens]MBG6122029.1 hypothetical protein [Corynebacterium aquatimens]WJY65430.1 hypothetical protein CAQUA_03585 [Corynebacterium aquatimens]